MYKKTIFAFIAIIAVAAGISFLIVTHEKSFPRKVEKIESTNHVRALKNVEITRLSDDLDYGLNMVNIGDSINVLIYNGSSKCSMVVLSKNKHKNCKPIEEAVSLSEDLYAEKHFDCYVEEVLSNKEYVTECGIPFTSENRYKKGQILKNFTSPKHK